MMNQFNLKLLTITLSVLLIAYSVRVYSSTGKATIFDEIDRLHREGVIDIDLMALCKIYALVKPEYLPECLKNGEHQPVKCGTSIVLEVLRMKEQLSPWVYAEIQRLLLPDTQVQSKGCTIRTRGTVSEGDQPVAPTDVNTAVDGIGEDIASYVPTRAGFESLS